MDIQQVIDFIGEKKVVVYGAGILGKTLTEILNKYNILVKTYIITDGQKNKESQDGIPVISLSEWAHEYDRDNECVLVSMSDYYKNEVEKLLKKYKIDNYLWIKRELFTKIVRKIRPVASNEMLMRGEPISRAYGSERGKPIDRYYIEKFLEEEATFFQYAKKIIEVGDDRYSKRYFPNAAKYDILDYRKGMDLTKHESLPKELYDVFICTQTLNVIYDVKEAIKGAYYMLKPGGVMLATVMGPISQVSSNDMKRWGDYWRFTNLGIEHLMREVFDGEVKVIAFGNAPIATAWIQGMCLEDLPDRNLLDIKDEVYTINIGICAQKK